MECFVEGVAAVANTHASRSPQHASANNQWVRRNNTGATEEYL